MASSSKGRRLVAGAMTGTSIDGIDAALVRIERDGLDMRAEFVGHRSRPLGALGDALRAAAGQTPMTAGSVADVARTFGQLHADIIADLVDEHAGPGARLDLVAVHGQTVCHVPPLSWQLVNPAPIARRLAVPVVSDLRQADLAAGGQGAPITPLADWILFRGGDLRRAIVNLGGFCNITILPAANETDPLARIEGADVCACNHILDAVARRVLGAAWDSGGRAAGAGTPDPPRVAALGKRLGRQAAGGRSLGTGDEITGWVEEHETALRPSDLAATAVHAIAACIAERLRPARVGEVILSGGGTHNRALVAALSRAIPAPLVTSDERGLPVDAREAVAIAVLGALSADGIPITLPQVTGCAAPAPVAGRWCLPGGLSAITASPATR